MSNTLGQANYQLAELLQKIVADTHDALSRANYRLEELLQSVASGTHHMTVRSGHLLADNLHHLQVTLNNAGLEFLDAIVEGMGSTILICICLWAITTLVGALWPGRYIKADLAYDAMSRSERRTIELEKEIEQLKGALASTTRERDTLLGRVTALQQVVNVAESYHDFRKDLEAETTDRFSS